MYPVEQVRITSPYGVRKSDKWHYGVDFGSDNGSEGDNIFSIEEGVVRVSKNDPNGYGEYIVIEHNGYCVLYAHLSVRLAFEGETVTRGEIVAKMGRTPLNRGLGVHLHAEVRNVPYSSKFWEKTTINGRSGVPKYCVDPIPYFEKDAPSKWAEESWQWAVDRKIVDGSRPKEVATREQIVQMLYNYNRR